MQHCVDFKPRCSLQILHDVIVTTLDLERLMYRPFLIAGLLFQSYWVSEETGCEGNALKDLWQLVVFLSEKGINVTSGHIGYIWSHLVT